MMKKKQDIFIVTLIVMMIIMSCGGCGMTFPSWFDSVKSSSEEPWEGTVIIYEVQDDDFTSEDLEDTIYKLQLRVAEFSSDAAVYQEGIDEIIVEIPDILPSDIDAKKLGCIGLLQFVTYDEIDNDGNIDYDSPTVWLEGSDVESATAGTTTDSTTGATEYVVNLVFTDEAAEIFADVTETYLDETVYILYDGEIISAPTVESTITDGNCVIGGMEDYEEAATLASTIMIGNLSLTLDLISSETHSAE